MRICAELATESFQWWASCSGPTEEISPTGRSRNAARLRLALGPAVQGGWSSGCDEDPFAVPLVEKGDLLTGVTDPYRVTLAVSGTLDGQMSFAVNSDPPLPTIDIISLVFGQAAGSDLANPELRALRPNVATQTEEQLLKAGILRILAGGITGTVGRAVEQTLGIDTVQISPSLGTSSADPLTPTARLILGKRLSERAYLTFSRSLGTTAHGDQIIILEYDQSDRVGWVVTQNGDRTFALDFRVRHRF